LAKLHYEIAIEIAADFPNAHYNLGLVLALLKDYQGAIDALTTYRKLAPADDLGKTNDLINSLTRSITD
jgi:tetratricopeptide (TPR) repeat protein